MQLIIYLTEQFNEWIFIENDTPNASVESTNVNILMYSNLLGSFVYSRTHTLSPSDMEAAKKLITEAGMDPSKFCVIRNQCFLHDDVQGHEQGQGQEGDRDSSRSRTIRRSSATQLQTQTQTQSQSKSQAQALGADTAKPKEQPNSFWNILHATEVVTGELADWFEDPAILSEWLVSQQVKMTPEQTVRYC
jgi:hypothetical protein